MEMLIGADVVPTDSNKALFEEGNVKEIIGSDLNCVWNNADLRVFNLEAPLTDQENPIAKKGPNLKAPSKTIEGINRLNPSLVTLANNHILDQGEEGLHSTQHLLSENSIPYIGADENLKSASKPYILEKEGISIGLYTCAEHEFTIAKEDSPGANPFDPLESLDHIESLSSKCDYVIVLYHGGKEYYRYPSPNLQKVCRKIVQKGADLVVCQHSHCVGAFEEYEGSTIVYGQGNFIFNKRDNEYWNTSVLVKVDITDNFNVDYIPIVRTDKGTKLANQQESHEILSGLYQRSEVIKEKDFVAEKYSEYAQEHLYKYLRSFTGFGKWLSRIDRFLLKGMLLKRKYRKQKMLGIQNYVECEAHRELLLKGIKDVI